MDEFSLCIVIPCRNHARRLRGVLEQLASQPWPCLVVDDGSDDANHELLERLQAAWPQDRLLTLQPGRGKGAAVLAGMRLAARQGFTHVLQIDADGQHDCAAVPVMAELARRHPGEVIAARPVFDATAPAARRWGRRLTDCWVRLETCSGDLPDSMCGLRVYPLTASLQAAERLRSLHMGFDIEILVRLHWAGVPLRFIPVRVSYPEDNTSNFRMFLDNWEIALTHARLCCALPAVLLRRLAARCRSRRAAGGDGHWAHQGELRGQAGIRLMVLLYRYGGRRLCRGLLYPVTAVYWLTASAPRRHSRQWLQRVRRLQEQRGLHSADSRALHSFNHFYGFGCAMLDKFASWNGELRLGREVCYAPGAEECLKRGLNVSGKLIIGSHLGDLEVCRALAGEEGARAIHVVVFTRHAQGFAAAMEQLAPRSRVNLMAVDSIGPDTAPYLRERIARGELVAIVGDRVSPYRGHDQGYRVSMADFMGGSAPFPQGPFILAALLACPVILLFALREHGRLMIHAEDFAERVVLRRSDRSRDLQAYITRYAQALERQALTHPLDWYNFYDFFARP